MSILKHLVLMKEYVRLTLAAAMEYRFNFLLQAFSMIINDGIWIIFWLIFYNKFPVVIGWTSHEVMMLYAILTFSYGLAGFFFGNRNKVADVIAEGKLDFYLALPKNELFHLLIGRSTAFAMGDMIFGLGLALVVLSFWQWPLFLFMSLISVIIIISFGIIVGSLAFYWGNAAETARSLYMGLISFSSYPFPVFTGTVRIFLLLVIPAGFVTGIPVQLLKSFDLQWFLLTLAFTFIFTVIAVIIFKRGLKKYESGNLINVRV